MAEKYFPGENALGKIMILDNNRIGKVTAVFDNIPSNSHFHFDILIGFVGKWPLANAALSQDFLNGEFATYILLEEGKSGKEIKASCQRSWKNIWEKRLARHWGQSSP